MPRNLLWQYTFSFQDYNNEIAETTMFNSNTPSEGVLLSNVGAYESVLSALSDAYIPEMVLRKTFRPTTPSIVKGQASSYDRLIILCREGGDYGSITIPAPSPLAYLSQGPHRGYKVNKSDAASVQAVQRLLAVLQNTVLSTGLRFPTAEWEAALMVNQP